MFGMLTKFGVTTILKNTIKIFVDHVHVYYLA